MASMYDWTIVKNRELDIWHRYKTGQLAKLEDGTVGLNEEVFSWHKWRTGQLVQLEEWAVGTAYRLRKMVQRKE